MKKVLYLLLLIIPALFVASCSSDDEPKPTTSKWDAIYGTWDMTHVKVNETWMNSEGIMELSMTFNTDKTFSGRYIYRNRTTTTKGTFAINTATKTIQTTSNGTTSLQFVVQAYNDNVVEVGMTTDNDIIYLRAKKR